MTEREHRRKKTFWRIMRAERRQQQKAIAVALNSVRTHPASPAVAVAIDANNNQYEPELPGILNLAGGLDDNNAGTPQRKLAGRKRVRKNRSRTTRKLEKCQENIVELENNLLRSKKREVKYRVAIHRLKRKLAT